MERFREALLSIFRIWCEMGGCQFSNISTWLKFELLEKYLAPPMEKADPQIIYICGGSRPKAFILSASMGVNIKSLIADFEIFLHLAIHGVL